MKATVGQMKKGNGVQLTVLHPPPMVELLIPWRFRLAMNRRYLQVLSKTEDFLLREVLRKGDRHPFDSTAHLIHPSRRVAGDRAQSLQNLE